LINGFLQKARFNKSSNDRHTPSKRLPLPT
jgi:hypothetical protein